LRRKFLEKFPDRFNPAKGPEETGFKFLHMILICTVYGA
jgi:hypothetical protein